MQIDILDITENYIIADVDGKETHVKREDFQVWADDNDLRDYCNDYSEYTGEHLQETGTMDWSDYYDCAGFKKDLEKYLTVRDAKTGKLKDLPDMGAALKKLLNKYK